MSDRQVDPQLAVDAIIRTGKPLAQARAERIYVEEYRKTLKAILMRESGEKSAAAQEVDAYAHERYQAHLLAIKEAVRAEEELRWTMVAAQARIEVWRSTEASARAEGRATQ